MKKFSTGFFAAVFLMVALALFGLARWGDALKASAATFTVATAVPYQVQQQPGGQPVQVWAATAGSQPAPVQPEPQVMIVEVTAVPLPTNTPQPPTVTSTPAPTRPAIDQLPQGEGPYTPAQMQICRDVWAQNLQGELTVHQFGYCQGVVARGQ